LTPGTPSNQVHLSTIIINTRYTYQPSSLTPGTPGNQVHLSTIIIDTRYT